MPDITKSQLPPKENGALAEDLLARFPGVDRGRLCKDIIAQLYFWMRWGNKQEELAACKLLNGIQIMASKQDPNP